MKFLATLAFPDARHIRVSAEPAANHLTASVRRRESAFHQEALDGVAVVWLEKVTDEQYVAGPSRK